MNPPPTARNTSLSLCVSVVIPAYNQARCLPQAVRCVLAQTYLAWELIIVDDGSTDDTGKIAAQVAEPRIRYVYQSNQGLSAARNTGVRLAEGCYLALLDADDTWEHDFLAQTVRILDREPSLAAVITGYKMIDENDKELPQGGGQALSSSEFRQRILEGGFFPPNAAIARTAVVREAGSFDTQFTSVEDLDLWLRISARHNVQSIPDRIARYRVYPGSMSTDVQRMHANYLRVLEKHLGAPVGDPAGWPADKRRAFGCAYRFTALGHLQQGRQDQAWQMLGRAAEIWPDVLTRLNTWFEFACGAQPRGFRGTAHYLELAYDPAQMMQCLEQLLAAQGFAQTSLGARARAHACLALSQVRALAGDRSTQRVYLRRAIRWHPQLVARPAVVRRLIGAMIPIDRPSRPA